MLPEPRQESELFQCPRGSRLALDPPRRPMITLVSVIFTGVGSSFHISACACAILSHMCSTTEMISESPRALPRKASLPAGCSGSVRCGTPSANLEETPLLSCKTPTESYDASVVREEPNQARDASVHFIQGPPTSGGVHQLHHGVPPSGGARFPRFPRLAS